MENDINPRTVQPRASHEIMADISVAKVFACAANSSECTVVMRIEELLERTCVVVQQGHHGIYFRLNQKIYVYTHVLSLILYYSPEG